MQRGKMSLIIVSAAAAAFVVGSASGQVVWTDDMEAYAPGSGILGQGGWTAWGDDPAWDSFVSDAQANSGTNSLDVNGDSDSVYRFNINHGVIDSGQWTVTTNVYVPANFGGISYFILMNAYDGVSDLNWSTQVLMDADEGMFIDSGPSGAMLPFSQDAWVEIRVEIDLDNDTQDFYVGGALLYSGSWTEHISGGGQLQLQAMDLFANGASPVYYDDFQLEKAEASCLSLGVGPLVGGEETAFDVSGGTPGTRGAVVWGTGGGPTIVNDLYGWCATFGFNVRLNGSRIVLVGSGVFDGDGSFSVSRTVPTDHSGLEVLFQAAAHDTCPDECMSDVVSRTIE